MLAAVLETEAKPLEDDEIDDASLLSAEDIEEKPEKEEEEVDYLEGITTEMFDSEDFEQCAIVEDVEALPDAHYGLLGSSKVLLQPQGCIDDLPEEVLRQVLSLVPAQDLYRGVQLVCHRWRNIVQDPKFLPYKKQYFRYMMRESDMVQEVVSVLKNNGFICQAHHSIRALVILMAQHKPAHQLRPDDVLERVKKHRLFPQAEASIRLRIPVIQKDFNLGIQGTNPYAAMAVILILSESVEDVQSLVSLLDGCMLFTDISEYLNRMAMMLLALKRNTGVQINNRAHYNIFYVLHLMEKQLFAVDSNQSRHPQLHLTGEQQMILSHNIQRDHVLKIMAFAGTGKTTTLVKYAEQRPDLHFLYVAFNQSVAKEAQRRFPQNVDCKTVHSLAFREVGQKYQMARKLTFNLKPFSINMVLPKGRGGFINAKVVEKTLTTFMASTDEDITVCHVPSTYVTNTQKRICIAKGEKVLYAEDANQIWMKMKNLNENKKDVFYMTHDGYLKLWQLSKPCLKYDVIFIDEAQDCSPAILDVMLSQSCGKILVGDTHQQIYTFKGAVNAMETVEHTHIYYLTQSFRFGAEISYVAATILKVCKDEQKILVGGKQRGVVADEQVTAVNSSQGKKAILSRTNVSVFTEAVRLTDSNPQCRVHFVGGIKGIGLDRIMDIWKMMQDSKKLQEGGKYQYIKDPFLRSFTKSTKNPFINLKSYASLTEDRELVAKLKIVETFKCRIPELVSRLHMCNEEDYLKADFILGTVHKAKGMEFDTVMVTSDFVEVPASRHNLSNHWKFVVGDVPTDEWNLLYVAVTRAKTTLVISEVIKHILTLDGEYFLKSYMPSDLIKDNTPLSCTIRDCHNIITSHSAFIMSQQPFKCTEGVPMARPLCERCVWDRVGPVSYLMKDDVLSMPMIPEAFYTPQHHIMLLALF